MRAGKEGAHVTSNKEPPGGDGEWWCAGLLRHDNHKENVVVAIFF